MRKIGLFMSGIVVSLVFLCLSISFTSSVSGAWTYQAADLGGSSSCIQDKLDQLGAQGGTNIMNATQKGVVTSPMLAYTGTFAQVFIETPALVYSYSTNQAFQFTNTLQFVASNYFVISPCATNFSWIAVGRVK